MGFRTFTTVWKLLWYYGSPVCGSPTQQAWDLILSWLRLSYLLTVAASLSLGVGYLFMVGSSVLLGESNGTPLQYSCLESPMDGGAWWATYSPRGCEESDTTERLHFHFSLSCIGEGNGNPLQCSCLENPRDGGAWWAAVYGVAQRQTRLKRLSRSHSNRSISVCNSTSLR